MVAVSSAASSVGTCDWPAEKALSASCSWASATTPLENSSRTSFSVFACASAWALATASAGLEGADEDVGVSGLGHD